MKKIITLILRFLLSFALLCFLFTKINIALLFNIVKNSEHRLLFLGFSLYIFLVYLTLFRWDILLKGLRLRFKFTRLLVSFSGGLFFNLFLPTSVGGDIVRGLHLGMYSRRTREVVASVILDRISGYVALTIIAVISLIIGFSYLKDKVIVSSIAFLTLLLIVSLIFLFNAKSYRFINRHLHKGGKFRRRLRNLHREIFYFQARPKIIAKHFVISLFVQIGSSVLYYITASAFGVQKSVVYFLVITPIIFAFSMLPITIGGLGLRDMGAVFFFSKIGIPKEIALAVSLINFSFIVIASILGGIIYVFGLHPRWLQHHKTHPTARYQKTKR